MRCYITDEELDQLRVGLAEATGVQRIELMAEAAWHLRNRDSRLAIRQAEEAGRLLDDHDPEHPQTRSLRARLALTCGEAYMLQDQIDLAAAAADTARSVYAALADDTGCCDALHVQARIAHGRSAYQECIAALEEAAEHARRAGDAERVDIVCNRSARCWASRSIEAAEARWASPLSGWATSPVPAVRALANDTLGFMAFVRGDFRRAIECYSTVAEAVRSTGQRDLLIYAAANIGTAFASLNDMETSLEWMQVQLDLARNSGWPRRLAQSLLQAGKTLRDAGKPDAGYALLLEAEALLEGIGEGHAQGMKLLYLAEAELEYGRHEPAMARLTELEAMAATTGSIEMRFFCLVVQSKVLSAMGEASRALDAAGHALVPAEAQGNLNWKLIALEHLADVHRAHALCLPADSNRPNGALHYLHAALETAEAIPGMQPEAELLSKLAEQHAKVDDFKAAFDFERRASEARQRENSELATNRTIAMEVRHKTANAQASAKHHEQLAEAHNRRAETLAQTNLTLDRLSAIGQQITAHLDERNIFSALRDHANGLLDAASLSIYLLDDAEGGLRCAFGTETERTPALRRIALDDPHNPLAACARSERELLLDGPRTFDPGADASVPGAAATTSALFSPLLIEGRLLGVMTVRSVNEGAYGERERLIFRTLCAYGAIALANADAYRRLNITLSTLETTQAELLRKNELQARMNAEREATLAFLAHDLRAPLNALVYILPNASAETALQRAHMFAEHALALTDNFLEIVRIGLLSPQTRTPLELSAVVDDACDTLRGRAFAEGKSLDVTLRFGTPVLGHREALLRATCNLIDNALKTSAPGGRVRVDVRNQAGRIKLRIIDRGTGMPVAAQQQLLTGSRGAPGTGRLGLAIVAQVAELHGAFVTLRTSSAGSCVCLSFEPVEGAESPSESACPETVS